MLIFVHACINFPTQLKCTQFDWFLRIVHFYKFKKVSAFQSLPFDKFTKMEGTTDQEWDFYLGQKFKVYQAEENIYVNSSQRANCPETYMKFICDGLHNGDVPHALRMLYREAVYGTNERV